SVGKRDRERPRESERGTERERENSGQCDITAQKQKHTNILPSQSIPPAERHCVCTLTSVPQTGTAPGSLLGTPSPQRAKIPRSLRSPDPASYQTEGRAPLLPPCQQSDLKHPEDGEDSVCHDSIRRAVWSNNRTTGSCIHLEMGTVVGIIVADIVLTLLIALSIFCFVKEKHRQHQRERNQKWNLLIRSFRGLTAMCTAISDSTENEPPSLYPYAGFV
ncbi:hypothetical protein JZ751_018481, partial [Albula glossodonta]